jgi:hypothetical protein
VIQNAIECRFLFMVYVFTAALLVINDTREVQLLLVSTQEWERLLHDEPLMAQLLHCDLNSQRVFLLQLDIFPVYGQK